VATVAPQPVHVWRDRLRRADAPCPPPERRRTCPRAVQPAPAGHTTRRLRQHTRQELHEGGRESTRQRRMPPLTGFEVPFSPVCTLALWRFERGLARSGGWREVENGAVVAREWHDQHQTCVRPSPCCAVKLRKYVRYRRQPTTARTWPDSSIRLSVSGHADERTVPALTQVPLVARNGRASLGIEPPHACWGSHDCGEMALPHQG